MAKARHVATEPTAAERYRMLFETSLDAIFVMDEGGRFLEVNPRASEVTGYPGDELLSMTYLDATAPNFRAQGQRLFAQLLEKGKLRGDYLVGRKDGQAIEAEFSAVRLGAGLYQVVLRDVSERKRAEAAFRESEARFRQLADAMPQLVWMAEPDGTVDYYNQRYQEFTGISPTPGGDWQWAPVLHEDDVAATVAAWETAVRTGQPYEIEHRVRMADGMYRWHLSRGVPARDGEGRVVKWYGTATDIHAQKRAEERLRLVLANSPDIMFVQDGDLRYTMIVNPAPPLREEEVLGKNDFDLLPEAQARPLTELKKRVMDTGVGERLEITLSPGGVQRQYEAAYEPLRDGQGSVVGVAAYARDITERKRAEEALWHTASEMNATVQAMPHGVVLYSPEGEGRIVRANPAAERIMSILPDTWDTPIVQRWQNMGAQTSDGRPFPPEQIPAARALRGEEVHNCVVVLKREGGSVWVSVSAAPIRGPDGKIIGAVATFTDITDLQRLRERQDEFLRAMSHDLRQPVTVVRGHAEILQASLSRAGGDARLLRGLDAIDRSAKRMEAMIADLVESARMEVGQLTLNRQPVDAFVLLSDIARRVENPGEANRVQVEPPEAPFPVLADPERIERAVVNLLTNALKYSSPEKAVLVRVQSTGDEALISVSDRGEGIPAEELPCVFERYYRSRTHRRGDGLGLGLYIARLIVEAHGGRIWADSEVGKGTTLWFTLPLA